jgi:hypothetical protein
MKRRDGMYHRMDLSKDFRFGLKSKSLQSELKAIFDVIKG